MTTHLNIVLRPLEERDAEPITTNANNINIWNNVRDYFPHPYRLQHACEFIEAAKQKTPVQDFAIEVNGSVIGCAGYIPGNDVERISAEIGYWIGEAYWGKGIATYAVKQLVRHIFENTGIIRLFAVIFENNTSSMRVLEKAGFSKLGILHKAAIKNGQIINLHYFELLK